MEGDPRRGKEDKSGMASPHGRHQGSSISYPNNNLTKNKLLCDPVQVPLTADLEGPRPQAKQDEGEDGTERVDVTSGEAAPEVPVDCKPPNEPEPPHEGIDRSPPVAQPLPSPPNHPPQQEILPAVQAETGRGLKQEVQVANPCQHQPRSRSYMSLS